MLHPGDGARNPGMCPHRDWNPDVLVPRWTLTHWAGLGCLCLCCSSSRGLFPPTLLRAPLPDSSRPPWAPLHSRTRGSRHICTPGIAAGPAPRGAQREVERGAAAGRSEDPLLPGEPRAGRAHPRLLSPRDPPRLESAACAAHNAPRPLCARPASLFFRGHSRPCSPFASQSRLTGSPASPRPLPPAWSSAPAWGRPGSQRVAKPAPGWGSGQPCLEGNSQSLGT